ncbi:MAG: methyltransferase [Bacteriovoracaceae bacterium]|jgi:ribosomal protein L11 methyltransferase|nr:methyltransferase [Bacteriovoracaceae bacterium]
MSKKYNVVLFGGKNLGFELIEEVSELAQEFYACDGVEEYCLEEKDVDNILKEKAFSGGDVKLDTINEIEKGVQADQIFSVKFYFSSGEYTKRADAFTKEITSKYSDYIITNKLLDYEDWNQAFRDHFKKIDVSDKLKIIPSWEKTYENAQDPEKIFIYPGQGFGTGNHETTYLCLKLYDDLRAEYKYKNNLSCLDLGCGSGILGIAAIKTNNFKVDFVDIDKTALENTLQNISLNFESDLEGNALILRDRFQPEPKNQLVFANILEHILIEEKETILNTITDKGYLIISGILIHQEKNIIETFNILEIVKIEQKNDWSAILFKKVSKR